MGAEASSNPNNTTNDATKSATDDMAKSAINDAINNTTNNATDLKIGLNPEGEIQDYGQSFERRISRMSPFELKDLLVSFAKEGSEKSAHTFLNAGRGNPDWIATLPRKAFFMLGQFAIEESQLTMALPEYDIAGMPTKKGCAERFLAFLEKYPKEREAEFLKRCYDFMVNQGFDPDSFVQEWSEGIIGCEYPVPPRILEFTQEIIRRYLVQEMCDGTAPEAPYNLFATEGGTAAMAYLFYSLKANFLVNPGDSIALMTPIFTPYIDIAALNDFEFKVTHIKASTLNSDGLHTWQYPDEELEKLKDPNIKLLCLVNPSNPPSYAMDKRSHQKLIDIVKNDNPNLIIISDDVYGTFVPHYQSLLSDLPYNTACVYSFSKYFGATGWRLAVVAMAQKNVLDDLIAKLPEDKKKILALRYRSLKDEGKHLPFIDRLVADSRLVALNGTAGLSTPQQVQMSLFALYALLDRENVYKGEMQATIHGRLDLLWKSLGFTLPEDPLRAGYYSIIDLEIWSKRLYGEDFFAWLEKNFNPLDLVIRLAKDTGVVVLNGDGFDASRWSVRVSLANLYVDDYIEVGKRITEILGEYHSAWKESLGS